jgi:hypothetical protein
LAGPFFYNRTDRVFFQSLGKKNKKQKFVTRNPGDTMGVSGYGSFFCLWAVRTRSDEKGEILGIVPLLNNGTIPIISPTIKKDPRVVVSMSFSCSNKNVSLNTDCNRLSTTYSYVSHGMRRLVSFMFCVLQASCGVLMVMQSIRTTLAILPSPKHI